MQLSASQCSDCRVQEIWYSTCDSDSWTVRVFIWAIYGMFSLNLAINYIKTISVRDEFHSGGLKSLARIFFSIAWTKIKWFCPNITWFFFARKLLFQKILGGLQPTSAPMHKTTPYMGKWTIHHEGLLHPTWIKTLYRIRGDPKRMQRFWSVISTTLLIEYRWFLLYWIEYSFPSNLTPSSSSMDRAFWF